MVTPPSTRRVLFLTGTRADFGKLKPLIARVQADPRFDCGIFATGMHTLSRYGLTINEIHKAGFRNVVPYINQISTQTAQMDLVLANTIQGLGHYVREYSPDMIVIHGDRIETLAGAIVGALNNILVAHIEGGELSGTVDELLRHSASKLAHLHFVANDDARRRLLQMGERPQTIFVIGSPEVDIMLSADLPKLDAVLRHYEIAFRDYGVFLYHPVTTELHAQQHAVSEVVRALESSGLNFVVIYPNNDNGSEVILEALERLAGNPRFRLLPSLRFEAFLTLLKHARAIVGNSSAGVREAPVYGVPTVNIGSRQHRRHEHPSIINVPAQHDAIEQALAALPLGTSPSHHFGRGQSADAFMQCLLDATLWATPLQKQFRDVELADGTSGAAP